ncbi:hypothetical protein ACFL1G_05185 [Planctomycetota bacterium]
MKLNLNKEIATKAYQYHYARCSTTNRIFICIVDFLFLVGMVILIPISIVEEGPVDVIDTCFYVFFCFILIWDLQKQVFRDAHWKREIKKLFDSTDTIDVEIKWSDSQIEIRYGRSAEMFKWEDFKGWLEANGLLLLYRRKSLRKKFFDMPDSSKLFDVIDLSQISQEEKALFTEILATKVNKTSVPSNFLRVKLTPVALQVRKRGLAKDSIKNQETNK